MHTEPRPYVGEAPPPPEAGQSYAATTVERTVTGDGLQHRLPDVTVYCTLTRAAGQWRVDQVETGRAA